ncbi:MAG: histidinol-phosphate transaminase [Oscillospiraceae bacterium]|nr:histidinol-phosphate transaminase [Oscillospiraceae bacterium]
MSKFLSEKYASLKEYVPGEQPQDKKYIKLNTNESPFPPSPKVLKSVNRTEVKKLRLYSDPESKALKEAIAENYGVKSENVFVSNGSDEILNFAFMAYGDKGATFADITYGFYKVFSELYGIKARIIPLKEDFSLDYKAFLKGEGLVVIANPNAQIGKSISLSEIEEILKANSENVVLIDEAYVDFGGTSALPLLEKYNNLLIVRTYSKSRSMAGARLGYAFASKDIIADLEKIKYSTNPYNVNRLTQIAGVAAVKSQKYYDKNCKKIIKNRANLVQKLTEIGFEILPSEANFILAKHPEISGEEIYLKLKERGILVRHFRDERISEFNRITIGTEKQMEALIKKLKEITEERK